MQVGTALACMVVGGGLGWAMTGAGPDREPQNVIGGTLIGAVGGGILAATLLVRGADPAFYRLGSIAGGLAIGAGISTALSGVLEMRD